MSDGFNWTCPSCGTHTTITQPNFAYTSLDLITAKSPEGMGIKVTAELIDCPNQDCKEQSFWVSAFRGSRHPNLVRNLGSVEPHRAVGIGKFTFLPTAAHPLSQYVPEQVRSDYNEAFLIAALSAKASATLARRALQGMIRDFFEVRGKRTLHDELKAIEDKCDSGLYEAMMGVKSVGNIGAHPEQDVNLIVDVEPGEPEALLQLIHLLDREWYVARADRQARIEKMKTLASGKEAARNGVPPAPTQTA
jgi:hypothetical protein